MYMSCGLQLLKLAAHLLGHCHFLALYEPRAAAPLFPVMRPHVLSVQLLPLK